MIQPVSTSRNVTVVHAPVELSISLYLFMGSCGRSLVVCCPRFELRVEDRVAIVQKFSPSLLAGTRSRVNLCCACLAALWTEFRPCYFVRYALHVCRYYWYVTLERYHGQILVPTQQRRSACFSRYNLPYAFVHTKIPSAYNPVVNNLPASGSHRPVLELGNRLPSLINIVWTE